MKFIGGSLLALNVACGFYLGFGMELVPAINFAVAAFILFLGEK